MQRTAPKTYKGSELSGVIKYIFYKFHKKKKFVKSMAPHLQDREQYKKWIIYLEFTQNGIASKKTLTIILL